MRFIPRATWTDLLLNKIYKIKGGKNVSFINYN